MFLVFPPCGDSARGWQLLAALPTLLCPVAPCFAGIQGNGAGMDVFCIPSQVRFVSPVIYERLRAGSGIYFCQLSNYNIHLCQLISNTLSFIPINFFIALLYQFVFITFIFINVFYHIPLYQFLSFKLSVSHSSLSTSIYPHGTCCLSRLAACALDALDTRLVSCLSREP